MSRFRPAQLVDKLTCCSQVDYVPRSKRYVRCRVEEVVESIGGLSRPQKVRRIARDTPHFTDSSFDSS